MVTDAKDFELLGDPAKMTGYSRPPENKLTAVTRVLGVCTAVVMMMMFVVGLSIGWSSPYLAQFTSGLSPFPATVDEISWMASNYQLGRLPGAILGAVLIQYFGTKTAMLGNGFSLLISWILVIVANSVGWIYVARFICGACIEASTMSGALYLADISSSKTRGAVVTLAMGGLVIGIVIGNIMGVHLSLKFFAAISLAPTLSFILTLLWLPHSPYYLMSKDKLVDAEVAIFRYNPKAEINLEVESIKQFLTISKSITSLDQLREFNIPRNRRITLILIVLNGLTSICGMDIMTSYMENIMTSAMVTAITPSTVPIIANSIGIIAGWVMIYLIDKFGRRILWVASSAGLCGSLVALGIHFYLIDNGFDPTGLQWLPICSVFSVKIFFNAGIGYIPPVLISELFPSNIRILAGCICRVSSAVFGFVSIYGYQYLIAITEEAYVWWIHAAIMLGSVIFGLVFVPDMKGKTLLEIQTILMKQ